MSIHHTAAELLAVKFEQIAVAKSAFWDALRRANAENEGRAVPDLREIRRVQELMSDLDERVERIHAAYFPGTGTLAVLSDESIGQVSHAFTCDPDGENYREVWTAADGLADVVIEALAGRPLQVGDTVRSKATGRTGPIVDIGAYDDGAPRIHARLALGWVTTCPTGHVELVEPAGSVCDATVVVSDGFDSGELGPCERVAVGTAMGQDGRPFPACDQHATTMLAHGGDVR